LGAAGQTIGSAVEKVSEAAADALGTSDADRSQTSVKEALTGWDGTGPGLSASSNTTQQAVLAAASEGTLNFDLASKVVKVKPTEQIGHSPAPPVVRGSAVAKASKKSDIAALSKVENSGAAAADDKQRLQHALDVKHDAEDLFGDLDDPSADSSAAEVQKLGNQGASIAKPATRTAVTTVFLENTEHDHDTSSDSQDGDFLSNFLGQYDKNLKDSITKGVQKPAPAERHSHLQEASVPAKPASTKKPTAISSGPPVDSEASPDSDIDSLVSSFISGNE